MPAKIGRFKRHLLAGPFKRVFESIEKGQPANPINIQYRDDESFFIKPESDRAIVIFSIAFRDADDAVIAKIFLQASLTAYLWVLSLLVLTLVNRVGA
jgi:actin related protein 2/3 complex subunit 2